MEINTIERQLQEINDRQHIHDLAMRYCRACDRADEDLLRTVFHEDAQLEYGTFDGSAPEFVKWVINHIQTGYTHGFHSICNEYVVLDGDVANGELYALIHNNAITEDGLVDSMLGGRYLDRYERREGEWRIAHRQFVLDWVESGQPMEKPSEGASDEDLLARGKMSSEDASYSMMPQEPRRALDW